jgi:hypothetical protein
MSSALAMVLAAGMVTGDGTGAGRVSGETAEPQRLDLNGEWRGVLKTRNNEYEVEYRGEGGWSCWLRPKGELPMCFDLRFTDEGRGRLQVTDRWQLQWWTNEPGLGIYKREGDRLTICYRNAGEGRPTSFRTGDGQDLLILRRVKLAK